MIFPGPNTNTECSQETMDPQESPPNLPHLSLYSQLLTEGHSSYSTHLMLTIDSSSFFQRSLWTNPNTIKKPRSII